MSDSRLAVVKPACKIAGLSTFDGVPGALSRAGPAHHYLRFRNVLSGTFTSAVDSSFDALDLILYA